MQGYLNNHQIEYVLYHLNFFIDLKKIENNFIFSENNSIENNEAKIIFKLSEKELDENQIFSVNNIPVLFPLSKEKQFYYFEKNNLIFNHDIFKSAFYLLSGYQEIKSAERDNLGRFPYKNSLQKKLSITTKPIVNYYFKIIIDGILEFSEKNKIKIEQKQVFENPTFILSHDIDRIKTRYFSKIPFKTKQLLGLKPSNLTKKQLIVNIFKYLFKAYKKFWSFEKLIELEEKHNVRSAFYFLDNNHPKDSIYSLNDENILKVIRVLVDKNYEVGIHGTFLSYLNENELSRIKNKLEKASKIENVGIRQHYLRCEVPKTQKLQQKAGYLYDTTIGFAEHEGFRNSFCHPFKLYDFENDKMLDIWEIPLVVMDGTLFEYRGLDFKQAKKSIKNLSEEIKKFNGVLSVLWHNDYFDEVQYQGITGFYTNLLSDTLNNGFVNMLGTEAVKNIEENMN